ncbi:MAG: T9SS type A sorting domain-containing protein [Bacteroidales bacterium]|nr:T9SS type A sorting domain-containing protein [Bacteroidales bacterium]MDD3281328.1 T9SS type A sorting domain-containing protein [Bacteroidales bacterium]MDD4209486.1 T9SS type A sorting domain-containing protein [Bacteroidales bacterium]
MKNHTLTLILATFILYTNAQVIVSPINSSIPKTIKSKEIAVFPTSNQKKLKAFDSIGTFHSTFYLKSLIPNMDSLKTDIYPILPDSCLRVFIDNKENTTIGYMGFGFNFDPYSPSFDENFTKGIFPTPPSETYNYRLDTLTFRGVYFTPLGYNASSPDTLRVYISFYEVYNMKGNGTDYNIVYFEYHDTMYMVPCVNVTGYENSKGGVIEPKAKSTTTIDYILTDKDTSRIWDSIGNSWYTIIDIVIPLTYNGITYDGFEIPCRSVLSVMPTFKPGYDYQLGDTLYYGITDPNDSTVFADGYPIRKKNYFAMLFSYMDSKEKYFADPFGFNNTIIANKELLYQLHPSSASFLNSCYYPVLQVLPDISFTISADFSVPCYEPSVNETNKIIPIIYPNPAKEILTIQLKNDAPANIKLYNILGQEVKSFVSADIQTTINVSDLHSGIYIIKVDQDGKRFTSKISIE